MIHVLDHQTDQIVDFYSNKNKIFWDDKHFSSLENYEEYFDFKTLYENSENLTQRNRIIIPDEDGFFREFIITETLKNGDSKEVYTIASFVDDLKKEKTIQPKSYDGVTVNAFLDDVLEGTGWQRGKTDYLGIRTVPVEDASTPFKVLKTGASTFEGELDFRIETIGNRIVRYVDFVQKLGSWNGKEITVGKDLIGVTRRETSENIVTALLCYGPEKEDGTRLMVEVKDEDARKRWGRPANNPQHLWAVYEPQSTDQDMTVERLRSLGETELAKRINSVVEYECDQVSIEHVFGFDHEKVRKGDTVRIKDNSYTPALYLEARVKSVERSISDKSQKKYILGDFIEYEEEDIMAMFRSMQKVLSQKISEAQLVEYAEKIIPEQPTTPSNPTKGDKWVDTSENPPQMKLFDGENWNAIKGEKGEPGPQGPQGPRGPEGRNLLKGTSDEFETYNEISSWGDFSPYNNVDVIPGETYTARIYLKNDISNQKRIQVRIRVFTHETDYVYEDFAGESISPGEEGYSTITFKVPQNGVYARFMAVRFVTNENVRSIVQYKEAKLEKGDIATDWSAAPEDLVGPQGIQGLQGPKGEQGIKGEKGEDGLTSYAHIAYADNALGEGFSQSPDGKEYIGMYADHNPTDSTNPADYNWSLIKGADGEQGIPGPKGDDGRTPYFHTAWANNSTGTSGFSTTDSTNKLYIGTYTDFTAADSTDPSKYNWSKIKGDKGDQGERGPQGSQGPKGEIGPQGPNIVDKDTTFGEKWLVASHIESLNGLNVGDQFVVDNNGNVTFGGHLQGASGTISGEFRAGDTIIDRNGILVNNGNFRIKDENTQLESLIYGASNMINDHSFELVPLGSDSWSNATRRVDYARMMNNFNWMIAGEQAYARIQSTLNTGDLQRALFGYQAAILEQRYFWYQYVPIDIEKQLDGPYTISAYFAAYEDTSAPVQSRIMVHAYDWNLNLTQSSSVANITVDIDPNDKYVWKRHALTIRDLPQNTTYLRVRIENLSDIRSLVDGVQLVPMEYPTIYQPEDSLFKYIQGVIGYN